ncbi:MAG: hypothetical protein AAF497_11510 [Planctomycetota bacterium]
MRLKDSAAISQFAFILSFVLLAVPPLHADIARDQARIDKFLKRRDFDQAEFVCRERLSNSTIGKRERAAYTIELLRVFARKSEAVEREDRRVLFESADREVTKYLAYDRDSPQRLLVRFQAALLPRLKAVLRQYDRPRSATAAADPAVLKDIRDANRQLRLLIKDVDDRLRRTKNRDPNDQERLSRKELTNLRARILLELGKTYQQQADAYPAGSDDRILAATESVQYLQKLSPASLSPQMWASSQLKLLASLRMKGDWESAAKLLRTLKVQSKSPSTKLLIHAELLRITHKRQEWKQLEKLLVSQPADAAESTLAARADWSLAVIESYLGLAGQSGGGAGTGSAKDWEGRATALLDERRDEFGAFWVRRVQSIMATAIDDGQSKGSASTRLLAHAAEGLFREGNLAEAIVAYEKAAAAARKEDDLVQSFELARTAAGIRLKLGDRDGASQQFRQTALGYREYARAAETHLLAIKLAASAGSNESKRTTAYAELLDEHLDAWPTSDVSDTAYIWRAQHLASKSEWLAAVRDYLMVRGESNKAVDAVRSAMDCIQKWSSGAVNPNRDNIRQVVDRFAAYSAKNSGDAGALASLAALSITLDQQLPVGLRVQRLESRVAAVKNQQPPREWIDDANKLLTAAYAEAGNARAAESALNQVQRLKPNDWLWLLGRLVRTKSSATESVRNQVLRRGKGFDAAQTIDWDALRARSLVMSGKFAEADQIYQRLIKSNPRDGAIYEGYAELLAASSQWDKSIDAYRHLVAHSPAASDRWFRGKLGVARSLFNSGQKERAAEIVRVLSVLHPELGGPQLKQQFQSLLRSAK